MMSPRPGLQTTIARQEKSHDNLFLLISFLFVIVIATTSSASRWNDAKRYIDLTPTGLFMEKLDFRINYLNLNNDIFSHLAGFEATTYKRLLRITGKLLPFDTGDRTPAFSDAAISAGAQFFSVILIWLLSLKSAGPFALVAASFFAFHPSGRNTGAFMSGDAAITTMLILIALITATRNKNRQSTILSWLPALSAASIHPGGLTALVVRSIKRDSFKHGKAILIIRILYFLVLAVSVTFTIHYSVSASIAADEYDVTHHFSKIEKIGLSPQPAVHPLFASKNPKLGRGFLLLPGCGPPSPALPFVENGLSILLVILAIIGMLWNSSRHRNTTLLLILFLPSLLMFRVHEDSIPMLHTPTAIFMICMAAGMYGIKHRFVQMRSSLKNSVIFGLAAGSILSLFFLPGPSSLGGECITPIGTGSEKWVLFSSTPDPDVYLQSGFIFGNNKFHYVGHSIEFDGNGPAFLPIPLPAAADTPENRFESTLALYENGKKVGPPHADHKSLRAFNNGRYSHWWSGNGLPSLFFTSTDSIAPDSRMKHWAAGDFLLSGPRFSRQVPNVTTPDAFSCSIGGGAEGGSTTISFTFIDKSGRKAKAKGFLEPMEKVATRGWSFRKIRISFNRFGKSTPPGSDIIVTTAHEEHDFDTTNITSIIMITETEGHSPEYSTLFTPFDRKASLNESKKAQPRRDISFPLAAIDNPSFVRVRHTRGYLFFVLIITSFAFSATKASTIPPHSRLHGKFEGAFHFLLKIAYFSLLAAPVAISILA